MLGAGWISLSICVSMNGIRWLDSTTKSIEEIATHMLHEAHLVRRVY